MLLSHTTPSVLQWQELDKESLSDTYIQLLINKIKEGSVKSDKWKIIDGRLWSKHRLVISSNSQFIPLILSECHDTKAGGHSGVLKTLKCIQ